MQTLLDASPIAWLGHLKTAAESRAEATVPSWVSAASPCTEPWIEAGQDSSRVSPGAKGQGGTILG